MKFKLHAGAEIDVLSPDEAREIVVEALGRAREELNEIARPAESGVTDATGAVTIEVYTVPMGYEFALNRLVIDADGFTPGAPFKSGVGFIDVRRAGKRVDFVNLQNGIPALAVDGPDTAIRFRNGEQLEVVLVGGPANTTVQVGAQGRLRLLARDRSPSRSRAVTL